MTGPELAAAYWKAVTAAKRGDDCFEVMAKILKQKET